MNEPDGWGVTGSMAEIYERVFIPAMLAEWFPRVMALSNPHSEEHILDVACGTGAFTRAVAGSVGPRGRVAGLDINPQMLAAARAFAPDSAFGVSIEWREGDVLDLPYESDIFDRVFCTFGLMFFLDQVAALQEMRRVLKPDGCLALSVWGSIDKCPGQMAMKKSWEHHLGADVGARIAKQHSLNDPEIVRSLIQEAGYRDIYVEVAMGVVRLPASGHLARCYGAMAGLSAAEPARTRIIEEVEAALQPYNGANGLEFPIEAVLAKGQK